MKRAPCKTCENYSTKKDYYSENIIYRCDWNNKKENSSELLRCNRKNKFFAYKKQMKGASNEK